MAAAGARFPHPAQPILDFVNGAELARYCQAGVVTPDHTIRTKNWPLVVPAPAMATARRASSAAARSAVADFVAHYTRLFRRATMRASAASRTMLDPLPRVALVPGLGLFGLGRSKKEAAIAADIAEKLRSTSITDAEAIGRFESISEADLFDMEYWSLEQAKLGQAAEKPLAGQIAVVTGAGGASARQLRRRSPPRARRSRCSISMRRRALAKAKAIGGAALARRVRRDQAGVGRRAFDKVAETFGGVDIVVSNAGAAWQGRIGEVDEAVLRESFELNFYGHQRVAQAAVKIMLAQGTGGCLLFNVSKQAVNPGPNFGPYGLPKAATLFLVRQYALDYGGDGIRSNAVNADRIRSGLLTDDVHQGAREGARPLRAGLHGRQSAAARSHRRRRGAGVPRAGAGAQDHGRRDHRRRRQHRRGAALVTSVATPRSALPPRASRRPSRRSRSG